MSFNKNFKPIFFLVLSLMAYSCNQVLELIPEVDNPDSQIEASIHIAASDLPQEIKNHLDANYPGETIVDVEKKFRLDGTVFYEVKLNNGVEIKYNPDGTVIESSDGNSSGNDGDVVHSVHISADSLPMAVKDTLAAKYPGVSIVDVEKKTRADGSVFYEVKLANGLEVKFNPDGTIFDIDGNGNGNGGNNNGVPQDAIDKALALVPGTVVKSEADSEEGVAAWKIEIRTDGGAEVEVYCSKADGSLLRIDGENGPFDYNVEPGIGLVSFKTAKAAGDSKTSESLEEWRLNREDKFNNKWSYRLEYDKVKIFVDATDGTILEIDD